MKIKRGFIFVETIVVTAILTISLLMVYSSYTGIIISENTRLKYDDPIFMYRTFYLQRFLKNLRLDLLKSSLSLEAPYLVMNNFNCDSSELFIGVYNNQGICENIVDNFHVRNMYLTYNDLSFLQECRSNTGKCEILNQIRSNMVNYVKKIDGSGKTGYRLIVEFAENRDGTYCDTDNCIFYYATISLGDL